MMAMLEFDTDHIPTLDVIAAEIDIYTNSEIIVEEIQLKKK